MPPPMSHLPMAPTTILLLYTTSGNGWIYNCTTDMSCRTQFFTNGRGVTGRCTVSGFTLDGFLRHAASSGTMDQESNIFRQFKSYHGLQQELSLNIPSAIQMTGGRSTPLKGLQRKLGTSLRKLNHSVHDVVLGKQQSLLPQRNRSLSLDFNDVVPMIWNKPAMADVVLRYVKIYRKTICTSLMDDNDDETARRNDYAQFTTNSNRAAAALTTKLGEWCHQYCSLCSKRHI